MSRAELEAEEEDEFIQQSFKLGEAYVTLLRESGAVPVSKGIVQSKEARCVKADSATPLTVSKYSLLFHVHSSNYLYPVEFQWSEDTLGTKASPK